MNDRNRLPFHRLPLNRFLTSRRWVTALGAGLVAILTIGSGELSIALANDVQLRGSQPAMNLPVRGVVRPSAKANISTDVGTRVLVVPFDEGETFRKNDLLIEFDCSRQTAELAAAHANLRETRVALKSADFLFKRNAGSSNDLETARARMENANATAQAIGSKVEACKIFAPFDGRIAAMAIEAHEMPNPSQPLFSIVAVSDPQIELIVPSNWLKWLKPGAMFTFTVDETGKTHNARIFRLGATVATVSQTIKAFARFDQSISNILPGMSGTAQFAELTH